MGFRFRKSLKAGPFRINFSNSGIGYSVGGKGLRFTKKAGGGTRTTTSIPGTGVAFSSDSGTTKRKTTTKASNPKSKGKKAGIWAAVIACFALLGACNDIASEAPDPTETAIIETTEAVDAVTEATAQSADELAQQESTATSVPAVDATTQPTPEQTNAPTEAPTEEPTEPEEEKHTYVLNTGTRKFHYEWCSSVDDMKESNKKVLETTREDVISRGYEPCGRCNP